MRSVDGSAVQVKGAIEVTIQLGDVVRSHMMVVADIEPDVLLGIDFLAKHGCILDLAGSCLRIGHSTLQLLSREGSPTLSCHSLQFTDPAPVQLAETIVVSGYGQVITRAKISTTLPIPKLCGFVEPSETFVDKFCMGTARVVTNVSEENTVPVRLQNLLSRPVTIHKDTVLGTFEQCTVLDEDNAEHVGTNCDVETCCANDVSDPVELFDLSHLEPQEATAVRELLSEFRDIMSTGPMDLGSTDVIQHDIETTSTRPIRQAPRRLPMHQADEVRDHVENLLHEGLIEPSNSPWAAPIVVVRKSDRSIRLCVDYRKLNTVTVKDAFPIPRVDDAIDHMSEAQYFSTLDLASGYWQVELTNAARAKAAFVTPFGLYEWKVMPFGLCNAPATFQRLMNAVLGDLVPKACAAYIDDTITFSTTFDEHLVRLRLVFEKFRAAGLKVKPRKCQILQKSVTYLGHVFEGGGVAPKPTNCSAVTNMQALASVQEVRRFVGFASYYRRFIKDFATIAAPLHKLTQKKVDFVWTDECQDAFDTLKHRLTTPPILTYPDAHRKFILDTDASDYGIGATLSQIDDQGRERVIAFASRALSKSQRRYSTTRREMYAVVFFMQYFKHYLLGANFTLRTDHKALVWLKSFKDTEGILARWIEKLEPFDFTVVHRKGSQHGNADGLSRFPEQLVNPDSAATPTASPILDSSTNTNNKQCYDPSVQCDCTSTGTTAALQVPVQQADDSSHDTDNSSPVQQAEDSSNDTSATAYASLDETTTSGETVACELSSPDDVSADLINWQTSSQ